MAGRCHAGFNSFFPRKRISYDFRRPLKVNILHLKYLLLLYSTTVLQCPRVLMIVFFFYSRRAMACSQAGLPTFPTWNIIIMHFSHLLLGSYENSRILYLLCFSVIAYGVLHEERVLSDYLVQFVFSSNFQLWTPPSISWSTAAWAPSSARRPGPYSCGSSPAGGRDAQTEEKKNFEKGKKHTKEYKFSLGNCVPVDMHYAHVRIRKKSYDLQKLTMSVSMKKLGRVWTDKLIASSKGRVLFEFFRPRKLGEEWT